MMVFLVRLVMTLTLGYATTALSADPIDRMIESLAATQSMSADFTQTTGTQGPRVRNASGSFYVSKPGLLRWEVKKPYPQLQILNTREFWMVDIDLFQASVRPVDAANLSGIAALLLNTSVLTHDQLMERYQFSHAGERDGVTWIVVMPKKPEPGIVRLMVGLDADSMISRFEIHDSLGQVTKVELHRILKNIEINPQLFQYKPPPGMSVLRP
ncbi:MAG: outer membrane lipoprotein chaperone LolA [Burkholderiaceae bacterium]|nr:outer membrane lipoprotein chaperone LolA [Burkholderiaceae bacterium]